MIFDFIEKHKAAFVAVMSVAMFGLYLTLSSCIAGPAAQDQPSGQGQASEDAGPSAPARSEEQAALTREYSTEEDAIAAQLASASWRGADGTATIDFEADGSFTETVPSEGGVAVRRGRVAIASVDSMAPELSQDGSATLRQFVCLLDSGEYSVFHLTLVQNPGDGTGNPVLYLSSDALEHGGEYTTDRASEELEIEGIGEEVSSAVDDRSRQLKRALGDYVRAHHSSCHTATWDKTLALNYDMGTVQVGFELTSSLVGPDGAPETEFIQMTYHMDTKTFEGGEA